MKQPIFYTAGETHALRHAKNLMIQWGYDLSPIPSAHVTHLLLPVPSFEATGILKGGQPLAEVLKHLPENITIMGSHLDGLPYRTIDFLKDEYYLTENAVITAHCTLKLLQQHYPDILKGIPVAIIGWGRIAKALAPLLNAMGAYVSVAVRRESQLQSIRQQHCDGVLLTQWHPEQYEIIINTAPAPVLRQEQTQPGALLIDLASQLGIEGDRVLWARGLPNRDAALSSGTLIAKTALRYALNKEDL